MARNKANQQNIDGSDLQNYPNKRIRDNDGSGNGTPVDETVYGDIHEFFAKMMREAGIEYNNLPDNVSNKYQLFEAMVSIANKNNLLKSINKIDDNNLSIPVKVSKLVEDEVLYFKTSFDSVNTMSSIKGSDNSVKPLVLDGTWKSGQVVRLVNTVNNITLVGLYDTKVAPNIITRLQNLENSIAPMVAKLAVFEEGGGMLFWNKPANQIPEGWAEVIDWRGRFPVGMFPNDTDFGGLGVNNGAKDVTLVKANLPNINLQLRTGTEKVGNGNGNAMSKNGNDGATKDISLGGSNTPFKILPPYRTVLFIEFVGI